MPRRKEMYVASYGSGEQPTFASTSKRGIVAECKRRLKNQWEPYLQDGGYNGAEMCGPTVELDGDRTFSVVVRYSHGFHGARGARVCHYKVWKIQAV